MTSRAACHQGLSLLLLSHLIFIKPWEITAIMPQRLREGKKIDKNNTARNQVLLILKIVLFNHSGFQFYPEP